MTAIEQAIKEAVEKGGYSPKFYHAEDGTAIQKHELLPTVINRLEDNVDYKSTILLDPPSGRHSVRRRGGNRTRQSVTAIRQKALGIFAGTTSSTTSRKGKMLRVSLAA